MSIELASIGRMLVGLGALLLVGGLFVLLAGRVGLPLGRLPGDLAIRGRSFSFYAPIATCLLLSVVVSLILWLLKWFGR